MPGGTGYFGAMSMCAHKEVPGLHITIQCISAQVSAASNKCKEVDHRQSGGWVDYPFCPFRVGAEFKACFHAGLTIRLSDAGLRCPTKLIYPNHRSPPWLTEVAIPRDRSNRLLCVKATFTSARIRSPSCRRSVHFPSRATSTIPCTLRRRSLDMRRPYARPLEPRCD
jgi:hypothetical protein